MYKGTNPEVDSYSVFWDNKKLSDTTLCGQLRMKGSSDIYVCGLAYDVCVGKSSSRPRGTNADLSLVLPVFSSVGNCCIGTLDRDAPRGTHKSSVSVLFS